MTDGEKISVRMSELERLDRAGLRVAWQETFKKAPPHFLSMMFMRKALIREVQCRIYGDIPTSLKRALKSAADGKSPRATAAATVRSGTQLIREWNGRRYQVDVTDDGYRFNGARFKSLSAIALRITGTTWSGPRFFGLTTKAGASQ